MKSKVLKYLFSTLFALLFVFASTGFNIVKYCCNDCAHQGIEHIAQHSCSTIHHDESESHCLGHDDIMHHDFGFTDKSLCHQEDNCEITRIQLDDFSIFDRATSTTSIFDFKHIKNYERAIFAIEANDLLVFNVVPPPDLSLLCGREILTKKAVLII
ncbi:MAG: hypothetical protein Q7J05_03655 [Paludibacter sp.]|nr:hypothetical protein [Paludibacter sp.]